MKVSTFFDSQIKPMISSYLAKANESVEIAVTWFTDKELYKALCDVARRGVRVELILANHHINHESSVRYEDLVDVGGQVFFVGEPEKDHSLMHLKFCIIDNEILITGSYNYTYKAQINHENVLISEEDYKNILDFHKKFIGLKSGLSNISKAKPINANEKLIPFVQYQQDSEVVKWGFCDENKNILIPLIYEEVRPFFNGFAAVKKNHLWGFVNQHNREIVKCEYIQLSDFKEEMAAVCKLITDGKFSNNEDHFTEGWGFVNTNGKVIVECKYNKLEDFNEGYALVSTIISVKDYWDDDDEENVIGHKNIFSYSSNLIDKQGTLLAKNVDSSVSEGFYVSTQKKKNPYPTHTKELYEKTIRLQPDPDEVNFVCVYDYDPNLDDTWLEVIEYKGVNKLAINVLSELNITRISYDKFDFNNEIISCFPFSEGYGLVKVIDSNENHWKRGSLPDWSQENTFFFLNEKSVLTKPFKYNILQYKNHGYYNINPIKEGLILVVIDESYYQDEFLGGRVNEIVVRKTGFVDINNQVIIPIEYEEAGDFCEGFARVLKKDSRKSKSPFFPNRWISGWGFINKKNKEIIPCIYDYVCDFSEGLAVIKQDEKYGYINKLNIISIPLIYDECGRFINGLAKVKKNKKYFYINKKGIEFYEEIESPEIKNMSSEIITIELIKAIEAGWELKTTEDDKLFLENDNEQYIILDFTLKEAKQNPTIEVIATDEENVYKARIAN